MRLALLTFAFLLTTVAHAQWEIQDAHITADLRGIDYVGDGVAWASGSNGTVLRTEDMGFVWQLCTTPPGAEKLDFRGVQAFDNNTAIVMSSGKGDLSRLYKTTDGCQTWKLVFANPDKDGFWDALVFEDKYFGALLGDPVGGTFYLASTSDGGVHWRQQQNKALTADPRQQGAFAASNSSLLLSNGIVDFGSGGLGGARLYSETKTVICVDECPASDQNLDGSRNQWKVVEVPIGQKTQGSGLFSLATRQSPGLRHASETLVAIGGDYTKPDSSEYTSAFQTATGWQPAITPPHGYRSAVAYDTKSKTWITVGPNGTDISTDDGRNWRALKPDLKWNDVPDADQHWNALSLPFVVGPHGRIGILREDALNSAASHAK